MVPFIGCVLMFALARNVFNPPIRRNGAVANVQHPNRIHLQYCEGTTGTAAFTLLLLLLARARALFLSYPLEYSGLCGDHRLVNGLFPWHMGCCAVLCPMRLRNYTLASTVTRRCNWNMYVANHLLMPFAFELNALGSTRDAVPFERQMLSANDLFSQLKIDHLDRHKIERISLKSMNESYKCNSRLWLCAFHAQN